MKKNIYNYLLLFFLLIIILYFLWNKYINVSTNSYTGVNMKCQYCHKNKGTHSHSLDKLNFNKKYENIASSGHMCNVCQQNPGSLHIHYQ